MEKGFVDYRASEASAISHVIAVVSLGATFAVGLLSLTLIVPAAIIWFFTPRWVVGIMASSIMWAARPWPALFHNSVVLESWAKYFHFTVDASQATGCGGGGDADVDGAVLYVVVPHGVFPLALPLMHHVWDRITKQKRPVMAVAEHMFKMPIMSPLLTWFGCVPAHKKQIEQLLNGGQSVVICPDGIAGAYHGVGTPRVYVLNRKGFARIAADNGIPIVPVFCSGHMETFSHIWPGPDSWLARVSRRLRFSFIFFWPVLPRPVRLRVVIGPTIIPVEVDEMHATFMERIQELYSSPSSPNEKIAFI